MGPSNICLSVCLATLFDDDLEEAPPEGGALLLGSPQAALVASVHRHSSVAMLLSAFSGSFPWCPDSLFSAARFLSSQLLGGGKGWGQG